MNIRKPTVANQFYPGNPSILRQTILEFLTKAEPPKIPGKIKAIISPHAGYIYSGPIAAYSYKILKNLDQKKEWKIVLLGPSHFVPFSGAAAPEHDAWETPLGNVAVKDIRTELENSDVIDEIRGANKEEHSLEVQVPFLQTVLKKFTLYPLVLGNLNSGRLAQEIQKFCEKDDVIVIASSDLSHYLPYEEAQKTDFDTSSAICDLDIEKMNKIGDACGKGGILTVMHLAKNLGWKCKMLNYRNSGDTAGDKSGVVGYGSYVMWQK